MLTTLHSFITRNKYKTLMQDVNRGNFSGGGTYGNSVLFAQFFCKPKRTLKNGHRR